MYNDLYWMGEAIKLADEGMKKYGELPIATILVANDLAVRVPTPPCPAV